MNLLRHNQICRLQHKSSRDDVREISCVRLTETSLRGGDDDVLKACVNLTETGLRGGDDDLKTYQNLIETGLHGDGDDVWKACEILIQTGLRGDGDLKTCQNLIETGLHGAGGKVLKTCENLIETGLHDALRISRARVWKLPPRPLHHEERGKVFSSSRSGNKGPQCTR